MKATTKMQLMGGIVEIELYDVDPMFVDFDVIEQEAYRLQKIFNFFDRESELSQLNTKREMQVSDELAYVLRVALEYCKKTNGKYDISKGKQIIARKQGREEHVGCSYKDILMIGNEVSLTHDDVLIDLGSIAKGYITDKLVEFIQSMGIESGLIDARGDIYAFGQKQHSIEIQHPRDTQKAIATTQLQNSAIATSGDYTQYYQTYQKSHIINKKDFICASVISPTLMQADVLATCAMLSTRDEINFLLEKERFILVDTNCIIVSNKRVRV